MYRPYNITFDYYHTIPLSLKVAKEFIKDRNRCKGGHWILHTEKAYIKWLKTHPIDEKQIQKYCNIISKVLYPMERRTFPKLISPEFMDVGIVANTYTPKNKSLK